MTQLKIGPRPQSQTQLICFLVSKVVAIGTLYWKDKVFLVLPLVSNSERMSPVTGGRNFYVNILVFWPEYIVVSIYIFFFF